MLSLNTNLFRMTMRLAKNQQSNAITIFVLHVYVKYNTNTNKDSKRIKVRA